MGYYVHVGFVEDGLGASVGFVGSPINSTPAVEALAYLSGNGIEDAKKQISDFAVIQTWTAQAMHNAPLWKAANAAETEFMESHPSFLTLYVDMPVRNHLVKNWMSKRNIDWTSGFTTKKSDIATYLVDVLDVDPSKAIHVAANFAHQIYWG